MGEYTRQVFLHPFTNYMYNVKTILLIIVIFLMTGCASVNKGQFSLIDIDLRTPEQLVASRGTEASPRADKGWITYVMNLFEVTKGRIRMVAVDIDKDK